MKRLGRFGVILLGVGGCVGAVMALGLLKGYEYVQHDPAFCHNCHIMNEAFSKWQTSPHHLIDCHQCHRQSPLDGLRQILFYVTQKPTRVVHHPDLDHKICAQCHLSNDPQWKLVGETAGHKVHFEKAGIDCLECHMGGVHEFLRPKESCGKCHVDKMPQQVPGDGNKMAFVHCTDCHNFLVKGAELLPGRATCLTCHSKITVGRESFPEGAPMSGFDCSTCHKPHEKIRPDRDVCLSCHADIAAGHHDMKQEALCTECHKPHRWKVQ